MGRWDAGEPRPARHREKAGWRGAGGYAGL